MYNVGTSCLYLGLKSPPVKNGQVLCESRKWRNMEPLSSVLGVFCLPFASEASLLPWTYLYSFWMKNFGSSYSYMRPPLLSC